MNISNPQLASVEVKAVVAELQQLVGGKVNQIHHTENELFLEFYVPRKGKKIVRVEVGKVLYLTEHKITAGEASEFCMQLRRNMVNAGIEHVAQEGGQRIVRFGMSGGKTLYLELFSKGNVVFCVDGQIIVVLQRQTWQSREVRVKEQYILPPLAVDIFTVDMKGFKQIIEKSGREKIVTCLATEIGLGGLYAEEVCVRAGVEKDGKPAFSSALWDAFCSVLKDMEKPAGYVYGDVIAPIELKNKENGEKKESFSAALDEVLSISKAGRERLKKEVQYQKKIEQMEKIISKQEEKLAEIDADAEENTLKADMIYEKYGDVKKLLEAAAQMKEKEGWKGVEKMLKGLKFVKQVSMKEKKVNVKI